MNTTNYRLFLPVAVFYTRRSDIVLQRALCLAEDAAAPLTVEDLRHLIDTGQAFPAEGGSYCVQFGGSGRYFDTGREALAYLCKRWRPAFIVRNLESAMDYAAHQHPAAMQEAAQLAHLWQNRAKPGGGDANC